MIDYPADKTPGEQAAFIAETILEMCAEYSRTNPGGFQQDRSFGGIPYSFEIDVNFQTGKLRIELEVPPSKLILGIRETK